MNIDGDNYSVVEEDDTYVMQKYEFIRDLEESTSAECLTIVTNLCAVNEMETESDEHGNITEWKLLNKTARAEAMIAFLNTKKFAHLHDSTGITQSSRSSQHSVENSPPFGAKNNID